ncbi:MAG: tyrosine-type recombinase/integrase [Alphaproteobacteria bacterium]|nr:tyrosine-type recombinase/integrase [Alphaproteobacteria bacterium]
MPLTDILCKTSKPEPKAKKLSDDKGLYLEITPSGGKYWRMKYRFGGKEKRLAFGVYPEVSLKEARDKRDEARKKLRDGIDPSEAKKEAKRQVLLKTENGFETVAREWHENQIPSWTPRHANYVIRRLELDIFPSLGHRPIEEITAPELLAVLRKVEAREAIDLAKRLLQSCGQIFRYATLTRDLQYDISAALKGALKTRKRENFAHLKEDELPGFLATLENYDGDLQTKLALKLLLNTFVRTTELRGAKWEEINWEKEEWRIPGERMKMGMQHIVPLTKQSIDILKQLEKISGHRELIFPNRIKPTHFISENTMLFAIYRMGYRSKTTAHGFRATASTILNEHGFHADVIERQLAHAERNKVRASYNHAQYLQDRKKMMQWWGDYLENAIHRSKS